MNYSLINKVDNVAAGYEFYTLPLQYSIASKIEQQITKFFNELAKNSINPTSPVIISDDISNTLIIENNKKEQSYSKSSDCSLMAVREGFEPSLQFPALRP